MLSLITIESGTNTRQEYLRAARLQLLQAFSNYKYE